VFGEADELGVGRCGVSPEDEYPMFLQTRSNLLEVIATRSSAGIIPMSYSAVA
jgi:hypothetical protein